MSDSFQTTEGARHVAPSSPASARGARGEPLVSVLLPTYNRRRYLPEALASIVQQTYRDLEILVVNDGGEDVSDIVRSVGDRRVVFINRRENRGKPYSLNEALSRARGKYVAYLDDDDVYYPHHVEVLVRALEHQTDCGVAYSDLYKTYCNVLPDGRRQVLSKEVEISRDFDRFLMLYFNHVLHVSLMHRRDLLDRTGPYNEDLNILIDWDMTRRLAFFSDFHHVHTLTGEFYSPVAESDRISVQRRKDPEDYLRNVLAIRTTRPAKPWPRSDDLSIILLADTVDERVAHTMLRLWRHTFYPYRLFVPLPPAEMMRLNVEMPHVVHVPVTSDSTPAERVDRAMQQVDGTYVAVVPCGYAVEEMWVEHSLYALGHSTEREGFFFNGGRQPVWGGVFRYADLAQARAAWPLLSVEASVAAAGIGVREPAAHERPFQFDDHLLRAKLAETDGNWAEAARLFEEMAKRHQNELWMNSLAARAYFEAGDAEKASRLSRDVNHERPTVDTLLLEAKVCRERQDFNTAIHLLGRAEHVLGSHVGLPAKSKRDACSSQPDLFRRV